MLLDKIPATNQSLLVPQMQNRIHKKVELFDQAFGAPLLSAGPSYSTHPGLTNCDPKDFVYGVSYEKLTNFIKVFVSPETALHKSGTCRPTCDLLDVTYSVCGQNETDCKLERERECLADDKCDNFNPVCPTGAYQVYGDLKKFMRILGFQGSLNVNYCSVKILPASFRLARQKDSIASMSSLKGKTWMIVFILGQVSNFPLVGKHFVFLDKDNFWV